MADKYLVAIAIEKGTFAQLALVNKVPAILNSAYEWDSISEHEGVIYWSSNSGISPHSKEYEDVWDYIEEHLVTETEEDEYAWVLAAQGDWVFETRGNPIKFKIEPVISLVTPVNRVSGHET